MCSGHREWDERASQFLCDFLPLHKQETQQCACLLQRRSHERLAAKDAMDHIRSAVRLLTEPPSVIGASGGFAIAKLRA